jgi:hypothetical protein
MASVKLSKAKIKTAAEEDWRTAEPILKVRKRLRTHAAEATEFFTDTQKEIIKFQAQRIKHNTVTFDDVASRGMRKLVESIARDKAFRSNIIGLLIKVEDSVAYMRNALSLVRRQVKGNYGASLRKEFKTVAAQNDAIEDHFSVAVRAIKQGELLIKLADMVITDIDKGGFNDQKLTKIGELMYHPGRAD